MRTLCDVCEGAAAIFFCAADEAALCRSCDEKVHLCNKLANRHVRVKLADPYAVPRCDICENAPAFFFCEVDGSSLCLQCDMVVHVGGKKTHRRYLMLRQRVEFPVNNSGQFEDQPPSQGMDMAQNRRESTQQQPKPAEQNHNNNHNNNHNHNHNRATGAGSSADGRMQADSHMIDVNTKPHNQMQGLGSNDDAYNGHDMQ